MPDQVSYYDSFGSQFEKNILDCPEPALWTTDYQEKGRIYREIKDRVETQKKLFQSYFNKTEEVLDIGCGFGRQALVLAQEGFTVTGIDTSAAFIGIANKLFEKYHHNGEFIQTDLLAENIIMKKYSQLILLDVLEHIRPAFRKDFMQKISELAMPGAHLIISLPKLRSRFLSILNNRIRKSITQHIRFFFTREEHPYPIPGEKDLTRLTAGRFHLVKQHKSATTDFYVLVRKINY